MKHIVTNALITTVPFGEIDRRPLDMLNQAGIDYCINPLGRRLNEDELAEMIVDYDLLIAGTEPITEMVMDKSDRLRMISRVGIGLDNVDLLAAKRRGIHVSYTPDAPSPAVAELTIALMLSVLRSTHSANEIMHTGGWHRFLGRRLPEVLIGIIGAGRIGRAVINRLAGLGVNHILVNEISNDQFVPNLDISVEYVEKDVLYRSADLISVHVPLTPQTRGMVGKDQLMKMKADACIVNTARGGIVDERCLAEVLSYGHLSGAAIDVFENEPYSGPLTEIQRCFLTSHMGSMTIDCRVKMEVEATQEAIRFMDGQDLINPVPDHEYEMRISK